MIEFLHENEGIRYFLSSHLQLIFRKPDNYRLREVLRSRLLLTDSYIWRLNTEFHRLSVQS
jgi:hypothetical protein